MGQQKSSNVVWHESIIKRTDREKLNGHKGAILWFTGLSGSGKSTLAHAVEEQLYGQGVHTYVLDGDNVRHGLCSDLGFTDEDRQENIRRIGEMAKLFADAGIIVLTAFISPFIKDRERARSVAHEGDFFEIYCDCSLEQCEERDVKGLYKKARAGEIPEFTGISSPYEAPVNPEVRVNTEALSVEESVIQVLDTLREKGVID
ncbi:MAG: adenylyl-sulfate kinase [Gammaproteobacteria bacterium]|nr:MAG: adenylyl-sulfate kinase [Gammaproteobacteria bacterium]